MEGRNRSATLDTVTSTTLLEGLRDPANRTLWQAWVERYRPVVVRTAGRLGLSADDAEDVAQNALLAFSEAYRAGRYDRGRGRLRSWLFGFVHNHVRRVRGARAEAVIVDEGPEPAAPDELEAAWRDEWQAAVLRECLDVLRREVEPATFGAFELFVLRELPARDVARRLELSENAVYGAKRRCLRRLRELEPLMEEIF